MKVSTHHFVNGTNVKDMTNENLISEISKAEAKIKELKKVEVQSSAIAKEIERIETFVKEVVKHLDARVAS